MSKVEASNGSDSSKEPAVISAEKDTMKRAKEQSTKSTVMEQHNDERQIKALIPVLNSNEAILSDDETPKIIWNMDTSDKNNMSDSYEDNNSIETIEVIESSGGDDGNEVTIMLEFTSREDQEENECDHAADDQPKAPPVIKKTSALKPSIAKEDTEVKESIAEIAKRQLETLTSNQKRGRKTSRFDKSNDNSSAAPIEKSKLNKVKTKESAMYIEIGEDTNKVQLPMHLLGRNKENPDNDVLSNGRKTVPSRTGLKVPHSTLASDILTTSEVKKIVSEKFARSPIVTVIDNRVLDNHEKIELSSITSPTKPYSSTIPSTTADSHRKESGIEIPQEYLYSDIKTEESYGITETVVSNETYDEDLLAILEGDHEPSETPQTRDNTGCTVERRIYIEEGSEHNVCKFTEEETRQIAMQQLMSLPKKVSKPKSSTLVDILKSDWSDNECKSIEESSIEIKSEKSEIKPLPDVVNKIKSPLLNKSPSPKPLQIPQKANKKIEKPVATPSINPPAFKRTRIIKKKIIWDPDAPETQISYASLVQGNQAKRAVFKKAVVVQSTEKSNSRNTTPSPMETVDMRKRLNSTSPSPSGSVPKKKKISELDKLLGDEGAINMLNALERESQKTPTGDDDKKTRMVSKTRHVVNKPIIDDGPQTIIVSSPKTKQKREIVLPKSVTLKSIPKKRKNEAGPKGRKSWDYVYSQRGGDDSLIIRRRSNSSYSSSASPRRLSLDVSSENSSAKKDTPRQQKKSTAKPNKTSNFQFAKPNAKVTTTKSSPTIVEEKTKKLPTAQPKSTTDENHSGLEVFYLENYIKFILTAPNESESKTNYLTIERMGEIVHVLNSIEYDDRYNCVLIISNDGNFCEGLDLTSLCTGTWDNRRKYIKEYSMGLMQFLLTLLNFKKPLIAGVQGLCKNLGVTILPLFDFVFADSTASFETDYGKLGQIPEGFTIASQLNKLKDSMICDMFYSCKMIPASIAYEGGLVTHFIKSGVLTQRLLAECKAIALQSTQALQAMKLMKQKINNNKKIEGDLIEEQKILMKHWSSDECQRSLENKFLTD